MPIYTHDQIDLADGILASALGILWGGNALQSITIGRHTPKDKQQAIGFLGTVDYTSGVVTTDVSLDTLLVEGCDEAQFIADDLTTSVYAYAGQQMTLGTENYVLTSCGVQFQGGQAATVSYGWLTAGLGSYLETQASPAPSTGEESDFCVVMGDDGSGLLLTPTWSTNPTNAADTIPILTATGAYGTVTDSTIPAGVQSVGFNSTINRDQILDVRTVSPIQFVTQYPVDITLDIELFVLPTHASYKHNMKNLTSLAVTSAKIAGKHVSGGAPNAGTLVFKQYVQALGLTPTDESESTQVGRYLSYNFQYDAADMLIPLASVDLGEP